MKFNANVLSLGRLEGKDAPVQGVAYFVDMTAAPAISPAVGDLVISTVSGTIDAGWTGISGSVTADTDTFRFNSSSEYEAWHTPAEGSRLTDITISGSPSLRTFNGTSWSTSDHPDGGDGITFNGGADRFDLDLATSSGLELTAADGSGELQIAADGVTTARILDANVTLAKLAADSVDASKIVDGSVGAAELASGSVGADALDEADAKLQSQSFTLTGDGSKTSFTCTHSFGTQLVMVEVVDDGYETVIPDSIDRTDGNTVVITFAEAPANTLVYRAFLKEVGTATEAAAT